MPESSRRIRAGKWVIPTRSWHQAPSSSQRLARSTGRGPRRERTATRRSATLNGLLKSRARRAAASRCTASSPNAVMRITGSVEPDARSVRRTASPVTMGMRTSETMRSSGGSERPSTSRRSAAPSSSSTTEWPSFRRASAMRPRMSGSSSATAVRHATRMCPNEAEDVPAMSATRHAGRPGSTPHRSSFR